MYNMRSRHPKPPRHVSRESHHRAFPLASFTSLFLTARAYKRALSLRGTLRDAHFISFHLTFVSQLVATGFTVGPSATIRYLGYIVRDNLARVA